MKVGKKKSESSSSISERDIFCMMVLLRWGVGAVGAESAPGGVAGGAHFSMFRSGEGRVPSQDYVGRGTCSRSRV
jgi:hypothetical protein